MLLKAKIRLIAATASCVIVTGGLVSMPLLFAQSKTASPATPTTQPQAAARATESTPQKTLKEFAAAVRKGDAKALVALSKFDPNEDNEKMLIESSSAYVASTADFKKAVKDKFGADALKEVDSLLELTPVGRFTMFIETSVDKAPAEIEGDVAMLQAPGAGDQSFWLERENGVWKLSVKRMTEHWTADEFQDRCGLMKMAASGLAHYTTAIQNGKYASLNELKLEIAPLLRQNR